MKDDRLYLVHMIETARRIVIKVGDTDRGRFDSDDTLQLALVHLIQIVGEAARRVGDVTRATYPSIPWREITGMRHHLVHDYTRVDLDLVWRVASRQIPELIQALAPTVDPIIVATKAKQGNKPP